MLRLLTSLQLAVTLALLTTAGSSAHEGGEDLAPAHLTASQAGGMTTVDVHILEPSACDGFESPELLARRLDSQVTGVIQQTGDCVFAGAIELPEQGRWDVTVRLTRDGKTGEASIPVGVSETASSFELQTWIHSDTASEGGLLPAWLNLQTLALYAVVAAATLTLVLYYRRNRVSQPARRA